MLLERCVKIVMDNNNKLMFFHFVWIELNQLLGLKMANGPDIDSV